MITYIQNKAADGTFHFKEAESKWLCFRKLKTEPGKKTVVVNVLAKDGLVVIGQVRWYGRWRKYTFWPRENTIYEVQCLDDISAFLKFLSEEHKHNLLCKKNLEALATK